MKTMTLSEILTSTSWLERYKAIQQLEETLKSGEVPEADESLDLLLKVAQDDSSPVNRLAAVRAIEAYVENKIAPRDTIRPSVADAVEGLAEVGMSDPSKLIREACIWAMAYKLNKLKARLRLLDQEQFVDPYDKGSN